VNDPFRAPGSACGGLPVEGVATGRHRRHGITEGRVGVLHGAIEALLLQDAEGFSPGGPFRSAPASTIPGRRPEHSYLKELGRAEYAAVTTREALDALQAGSASFEGIIPGGLKTAHAFAWLESPLSDAGAGTELAVQPSLAARQGL